MSTKIAPLSLAIIVLHTKEMQIQRWGRVQRKTKNADWLVIGAIALGMYMYIVSHTS